MRIIAFDTETHLIKPGCPVPKMVCMSAAEYISPETLAWRLDRSTGHLSHIEEDVWQIKGRALPAVKPRLLVGIWNARLGVRILRGWLLDPNIIIVGHNVWFDLGVCIAEDPSLMPLVFAALEAGRIEDTMIRQQLLDIADGSLKFHYDEEGEISRSSYHLADLSWRLLGRYLKKDDTWRLKYALLDGVPLTEWPEEAVKYSLLDSIVTLDTRMEQDVIATAPTSVMVTMRELALVAPPEDPFDDREAAPSMETIINSAAQHRAAFALYLQSTWGVRTDPQAVAELKADLEKEYAEKMAALRPSGLFKIAPARVLKSGPRKGQVEPEKITKNMAEIRARTKAALEALGLEVRMTEGGENSDPKVCVDRKTLKATKEPSLVALAEVGAVGKLLQTYVPVLEGGTQVPINCRYSVLLETGRTSASGPNIQNMPRD
jgi:DNA polymerase I